MSILQKIGEWVSPHHKRVYQFHEGSWEDASLLGLKGANLCELYRLKLPVPNGFIITSEACKEYFETLRENRSKVMPSANQQTFQSIITSLTPTVVTEYTHALRALERSSGRIFFQPTASNKTSAIFPLLLSVRSSCAVGISGLNTTILNVGMNDEVVESMCKLTGNSVFVYDCYLSFLRMYGTTVFGIDKTSYSKLIDGVKESTGKKCCKEFSASDLQGLIQQFKSLGTPPSDPAVQLHDVVSSLFESWYSTKAMAFRELHGVFNETSTGVIVQQMVFGNCNKQSGTGICYTRQPVTGEKCFFGEFLPTGEGDDVVQGIHQSISLDEMRKTLPYVYDSLAKFEVSLEKHYKDMIDIHFTVENGHLYILKTQPGKRSQQASVRIAVALVHEKILTEREALLRIDAQNIGYFWHPIIDSSLKNTSTLSSLCVGKGVAGAPGAISGELVFSIRDVIVRSECNARFILCLNDASFDDELIFEKCAGCILMDGSMTSPACVYMRNHGRPVVYGIRATSSNKSMEEEKATFSSGMNWEEVDLVDGVACHLTSCDNLLSFRFGDTITIDGTDGIVYRGSIPTIPSGQDPDFLTLLRWTNLFKRMPVLSLGDSTWELESSLNNQTDGVGLCRSSELFVNPDRVDFMTALLISTGIDERSAILTSLLPLHQNDYVNIFRKLNGQRCTITLFDPKVYQFLTNCKQHCYNPYDFKIDEVAKRMNVELSNGLKNAQTLMACTSHDWNFLEGDCRLWALYPQITEMQVKAIIGAAITVLADGIVVYPEIAIPSIFTEREVSFIKPIIDGAAMVAFQQLGFVHSYKVGCVIDNPRACMRADAIVKQGMEFVLFDLPHLTHHAFGCSHKEMNIMWQNYKHNHILMKNPFVSLDEFTVGSLIKSAIQKCRDTNQFSVQFGAVGEQVNDANTVSFLNGIGLDYLVCDSKHISSVKIMAAQAHIRATMREKARVDDDYMQLLASARFL